MIPRQETITTVEGTLEFEEEVVMTVSQEAMLAIIQGMTRMYSNPHEAILREYTSNAWDSHRAAGWPRAIEVTLPSVFAPNLVIQDWGLGMTREELGEFVQYGYSTKKKNNEDTGGFGMGSKSALAIATNFTVISVKDGKKNTVVIGLRSNDNPRMGLLKEQDTDEPNGVKVIIPTNAYREFKEIVNKDLFLGWEPGTILIDGKEPELTVYGEHFEPLGDAGWVNPDNAHSGTRNYYQGLALVNQVKYDLDWNSLSGTDRNLIQTFFPNVVLKLDNGEVSFPRDRDRILYDKHTIKHIRSKIEEAIRLGQEKFVADIAAASTRREAMRLTRFVKQMGFPGPFMWNGEKVKNPDSGSYESHYGRITEARIENLNTGKIGAWKSSRPISSMDYSLFRPLITGYGDLQNKLTLVYGNETRSSTRDVHDLSKKAVYLARALSEADPSVGVTERIIYYVDYQHEDENPWLFAAFDNVIEYNEASRLTEECRKKTIRLTRAENKARTMADKSVRVLNNATNGRAKPTVTKVSDLDQNLKYILLRNNSGFETIARNALTTMSWYQSNQVLANTLGTWHSQGYRFLIVNKTDDISFFSEAIKNIVDLRVEMEAKLSVSASSTMSKMDIIASHDIRNGNYEWATDVSAEVINDIEDVETQEWIRSMRKSSSLTKQRRKHQQLLEFIRRYSLNVPSVTDLDTELESPGARYRLIADADSVPNDLIAEYINSVNKQLDTETTTD